MTPEHGSLEFARQAHEGQEYGPGEEYIKHPIATAALAKNLGYPTEVLDACYLHDVVEDTEVSEAELRILFPDVVVDAVIAVTYTKEDELAGVDKIEKAKSHPVAHVVKYCDSSSNYLSTILNGEYDGEDQFKKAAKYWNYLQDLRKSRPSPKRIKEFITTSQNS